MMAIYTGLIGAAGLAGLGLWFVGANTLIDLGTGFIGLSVLGSLLSTWVANGLSQVRPKR